MIKKYDFIYESFQTHYPAFAKEAIEWSPFSKYEILVELSDGKKMIYNDPFRTIRRLNHSTHDDERMHTKEFSLRLKVIIREAGMTLEELENKSGITRRTLQKYLNASSKPSFYNATRLADALGCTVIDFLCIE